MKLLSQIKDSVENLTNRLGQVEDRMLSLEGKTDKF
jgi:hypothetical protein